MPHGFRERAVVAVRLAGNAAFDGSAPGKPQGKNGCAVVLNTENHAASGILREPLV
jgi:hypothetical protein